MRNRTKEDENSSQRIRQRAKQQNVRFHNVVTITEIPTHRIYSRDERIACWYTRADFYIFSREDKMEKARRTDKNVNDLGLKVLKALGMVRCEYDKQSKDTKELLDASMRVLVARRLSEQRLAQAQWSMPHRDQHPKNSIPEFPLNPLYGTKDKNVIPQIPLVLDNPVVPIKSGATPRNERKSPIARGA
mmetsp:Transcript_22302/g.53043  ORF Transcript_22302/g.53043 Transcript_22302/m.53043 type:complete len:189 (+) Transcript_22302:231-797(+)|eukprot:CAMPEP_0197186656 /NCGR_PEP_ID=MMETSP1423-20130617/14333_1 /TAXON_ID=476441 /ORGANISM="Pseudo-nitzschia heimii, Strain UNC1101" /LENGTH=188 /DNA_ID=CAMNT_0042638029 /DNA_START=154 /DNA_END=720 /DNA_ORIENTATION=+